MISNLYRRARANGATADVALLIAREARHLRIVAESDIRASIWVINRVYTRDQIRKRLAAYRW